LSLHVAFPSGPGLLALENLKADRLAREDSGGHGDDAVLALRFDMREAGTEHGSLPRLRFQLLLA
jgi:hypothetical protein